MIGTADVLLPCAVKCRSRNYLELLCRFKMTERRVGTSSDSTVPLPWILGMRDVNKGKFDFGGLYGRFVSAPIRRTSALR